MNILLFAQLAERFGARQLSVPHMTDTDTLTHHLNNTCSGFEKEVYMIAVDKNIVHENTPLNEHSIVALLPPFSGG
ncbi:MAG: MoaD/ThiS family protein [Chitinophagaceae bacterium]|nr:MoaD/ThiS family protein [Chitinophagaceae bacterium]